MAFIMAKMREMKLRWFGYVKRCIDTKVRMCERLVIEGMKRGTGSPNKYWREVIRHDMTQLQLSRDMTLDRRVWRAHIRVEGSVATSCLGYGYWRWY